jgi:hypothetical protein
MPKTYQKKPKYQIDQLTTAQRLKCRPKFLNSRRSRNQALAWGRAYENKVAKYLDAQYHGVVHEPWIEYADINGRGWCAPDILMVPEEPGQLLLAEVKLTTTPDAETELRGLYLPVVEFLYPEHDIKLLQISMNISNDWNGDVVDDLDTVFNEDDWEFGTLKLTRFPK